MSRIPPFVLPRLLLPVLLLLVASVPAAGEEPAAPGHPETPRGEDVVVLHGERIPDPYRWLEDDDAPAVAAWDEAQLALVRRHLDAYPRREALQERLEAEFALGGMRSLPRFRGGARWHTYRPQGANQPVLYRSEPGSSSEAEVILDPNAWSEDGTSALKAWEVSPSGRYLAYRRDAQGSEETTIHVLDLETREHLPETISRTKFSQVTWAPDSSGFYYNRMPDPGSVPEGESQYHDRIYWHRLGTLVLDDPIVYGQGRPTLENCWLYAATDERHLLLARGLPYKEMEVFTCSFAGGGLQLVPVIEGFEERTWVDRVGDTYVFNTDRNTGNREIFVAPALPGGKPGPWRLVEIPRGPRDVVKEAWVAGGRHLVVHVRADVVSRLFVTPLDGGPVREIGLPGPGTVGKVSTRRGDDRIWFDFTSYARALTNYRCDLSEEKPRLVEEDVLPTTVDISGLVSTRASYPSKDGTQIPIFLLHHEDTKLDGSAPTVLYGYGGFRVGMYPHFSRSRALWAELGGVYAVASLRGGDEYGEDWHEAGSLGNKQNVFDDFIAAADWLVETGKASREKLAIEGGSNGGLLVAACVNQRPDLCRAAICGVPLTDMLRYHRFQYAKSWTKEYGDPDVAEEFAWIRPYSPYHNAPEDAAYPAVLLTAGLRDGRVNAFHARKMAAVWQAETTSPHPILLRIDRKGGHSAAGLARVLAEILDRWTFLLSQLR